MTDEPLETLNISEKGRSHDGRAISLDKRLFMQLLAFGGCTETKSVKRALLESRLEGVLYEDLNDPLGIAVLIVAQDPDDFLACRKSLFNQPPFVELQQKPEYTMFGRTYALGHEPDLEDVLIKRPRRRLHDPKLPWAIWYPLRRSGSFESLSPQDQRVILMEHGGVGRSFGRAGYGYDVRLACYGLDKNDSDFVIGLIGPKLFPLSAIVERMRKTKQTSQYIERLGPFFVGKAVWQSESKLNDTN
jgi:chlorite dismutase